MVKSRREGSHQSGDSRPKAGKISGTFSGAGLAVLVGFSVLSFRPQEKSVQETGRHLRSVLPLREPRSAHTATLLPGGNVLIAGGFRKGNDGISQIYSATTEFFVDSISAFVPGPDMHFSRAGHTATMLDDGTVLMVGGFTGPGMTATAEIYDPKANVFTVVGSMAAPRGDFTATLLQGGKVLVAGGGDVNATPGAELYNPISRKFQETGTMTAPRLEHTAARLADGKVLVVGGGHQGEVLSSAEIYDPATGTFAATGSMTVHRYKHASLVGRDGNVLIFGGSDARDWNGMYSSVEMYDVTTGKFTPYRTLRAKRFKFPACVVQVSEEIILLCGGSREIETLGTGDKVSTITARFDQPNYYATATLLPGGNVLIAGGYDDHAQVTGKAWVYR
jgi:hypothetical protein